MGGFSRGACVRLGTAVLWNCFSLGGESSPVVKKARFEV